MLAKISSLMVSNLRVIKVLYSSLMIESFLEQVVFSFTEIKLMPVKLKFKILLKTQSNIVSQFKKELTRKIKQLLLQRRKKRRDKKKKLLPRWPSLRLKCVLSNRKPTTLVKPWRLSTKRSWKRWRRWLMQLLIKKSKSARKSKWSSNTRKKWKKLA